MLKHVIVIRVTLSDFSDINKSGQSSSPCCPFLSAKVIHPFED